MYSLKDVKTFLSPGLEKEVEGKRKFRIVNCSSIAPASLKDSYICHNVLQRLFKVLCTSNKKRNIFVFIYRNDISSHFLYKLQFDLIMVKEYRRLAERKSKDTKTKKRRGRNLKIKVIKNCNNETLTSTQNINHDDLLLTSASPNTSDETSTTAALERKINVVVGSHIYNKGANNLLQ